MDNSISYKMRGLRIQPLRAAAGSIPGRWGARAKWRRTTPHSGKRPACIPAWRSRLIGNGYRIVNRRSYPFFRQRCFQAIALSGFNNKLMVIRDVPGINDRELQRQSFQFTPVVGSVFTAFEVPIDKVFELDPQDGGLQFIETAVCPEQRMQILAGTLAVCAQHLQTRGKLLVISRDHAAVSVSPQVLCREEGKASGDPNEPAGFWSRSEPIACAASSINGMPVALSFFDLTALSKKMHGDDGSCLRCNTTSYIRNVHVESVGVHIDKHWRCFEPGDHACGGEEGVACRDDFIALLDSERKEREEQGVGSAGATNREPGAALRCDFGLQRFPLRVQDELLPGQHMVDGAAYFVPMVAYCACRSISGTCMKHRLTQRGFAATDD